MDVFRGNGWTGRGLYARACEGRTLPDLSGHISRAVYSVRKSTGRL